MKEKTEYDKVSNSLQIADSNITAWEIAQKSPDRDLSRVWEQIKGELEFAPESESHCWYSIPYKNNDTGKTISVEGIGVHGADLIRRAWGHCALGGGIREDMGDKVICRGIYFDHKNNSQGYAEVIVNRYNISKGGGTYRLIGKHWENAVQKGIAIARRNAFLSAIPEVIKDRTLSLLKELSRKKDKNKTLMTSAEKIQKAKQDFIKVFKIPDEVFDSYIDGTAFESNEELLDHLRGLYNGIKLGEVSVYEIFGINVKEIDGEKMITPPKQKNT